MNHLNDQQKELIFDYCMGLASEEASTEAKQLIESSPEAASLHSSVKNSLSPLDSLEPDICPDALVERTIWRLSNTARSGQLQLDQLLAAEGARKIRGKSRLWRNIGELAAVAATILILTGVYIPPLNAARQKSWQQACQMQLRQISQGINNYTSDHDGRFPAVATTLGAPWWKVGYQGKENHSNTRNLWLLVKNGYVKPTDFVCPGRRRGRAVQFDSVKVKDCNDFPARRYVTYSFRMMCDSKIKKSGFSARALVADLNPLFENLPQDYSVRLKLRIDDGLSNLNSSNHNRRGQNVLFGDGAVEFVKKRRLGIVKDDIFTLQNTYEYKGVETPSCTSDAFLAP